VKTLSRRLHVREEAVRTVGLSRAVRLLYASDLHLGLPWTRGVAGQVTEIARDHRPDALLLGGDLVETEAGLAQLHAALRRVRSVCPIYAVAGNHDHRIGIERLRETVESAGACWLTSATLGPIRLDADLGVSADSKDIRVLVAHNPSVFDRAAEVGFDLVLAGHLHGGQCVFVQSRRGRLYPGALFARYTGLRFARGRTTMLVSRGAADTLPLRWNCPREVILCTVM
jgi:predicted MPP superfamily phosphohydrolase